MCTTAGGYCSALLRPNHSSKPSAGSKRQRQGQLPISALHLERLQQASHQQQQQCILYPWLLTAGTVVDRAIAVDGPDHQSALGHWRSPSSNSLGAEAFAATLFDLGAMQMQSPAHGFPGKLSR